jgi:V/A-type H+-transporting ATPase subunit I
MAIVKMKRLRLLGLTEERDALFQQLQHLGCVEVSEQSEKLADADWAGLVHPNESTRSEKERLLEETEQALKLLDTYAPAKTPFLAPKRTVEEEDLFSQSAIAEATLKVREVNRYGEDLSENAAQQHQTQVTCQSLAPWTSLDLPLNTTSTASMYIAFGMMPASADLEAVRQELSEKADASELYEASTDTEAHYLLFFCHRSQEEAGLDVLKSYGFSTTTFKGITGTAAETMKYQLSRLETLKTQEESLKESLQSYGEARPAIQLCADRLQQEIDKERCKERLLDTDLSFILEGWVPEMDVPKLEALLGSYSCAYELSDPDPEEYPEVPVKLKNNKVTDSLNTVTDMYSLPAYGSLDPNPLMAPFFILFYGMMMADMGYGLLMFFGCLFAIKRMRPKGGTYHLLSLIKYCGISTFIFGAITGGFFGDLIPQLVEMTTGKVISLPALFSPLDDALAVLIGSLCLGLIQIFTGMGISMYKQFKRGEVMAALCNEGAWFLVFILIGVAALTGQVKACIIAIVVVLVLTQGYGKKGILGKLMGIGGSLYNNLTGYFSDILSYSRLMALMLAGAVIAQVFNTLGAITGNVVFFFLISIIGNALNFALNLLGCYVHDLRLQCLEFFGRFYEDGGKPFEPIQIDTKYVDVIS